MSQSVTDSFQAIQRRFVLNARLTPRCQFPGPTLVSLFPVSGFSVFLRKRRKVVQSRVVVFSVQIDKRLINLFPYRDRNCPVVFLCKGDGQRSEVCQRSLRPFVFLARGRSAEPNAFHEMLNRVIRSIHVPANHPQGPQAVPEGLSVASAQYFYGLAANDCPFRRAFQIPKCTGKVEPGVEFVRVVSRQNSVWRVPNATVQFFD